MIQLGACDSLAPTPPRRQGLFGTDAASAVPAHADAVRPDDYRILFLRALAEPPGAEAERRALVEAERRAREDALVQLRGHALGRGEAPCAHGRTLTHTALPSPTPPPPNLIRCSTPSK